MSFLELCIAKKTFTFFLEIYIFVSFPGNKGNVHAENEYGLIISADDPNLLDKLSLGAEKGLHTI